MLKSNWLYLGAGLLLGLVIVLGGWLFYDRTYTYTGSLIDPPAKAADFTLQDQNDNPFRLSDQHGKTLLVFFGYTHCADICPVTLTRFKEIKRLLGEQANGMEFVFITVDPERDSSAQIKSYLGQFDPGFIGLTGSQDALQDVWQKYGVYREKVPTGNGTDYEMDHSTRIYLVDKNGNWRLTYPFEMEVNGVVADLQHLLRG
jgi:protein SCO1/2